MIHLRIISNFALKFLLLALPAIGILTANSIPWNVAWWVLYLLWGLFLAKHEMITKTIIGTMWAQIPFLTLLDANLSGTVLWVGAALWAAMAYWHIYRQAFFLNRPSAPTCGP